MHILLDQIIYLSNLGVGQLNFNFSHGLTDASGHWSPALRLLIPNSPTDLGLLFGLGATFVLLGAVVRNRSGARAARNSQAVKPSVAIPTELS